MPQLYITQIKPNPTGRDRLGSVVPNQQLASEWVDIKNISSGPMQLNSIVLQHIAYTEAYPNGVWSTALSFNDVTGSLSVGETVRVHSGVKMDLNLLYPVDKQGAQHHFFTGKNYYVWNNNRSDTPRLIKINGSNSVLLDEATYSAPVFEGRILTRRGNSLI